MHSLECLYLQSEFEDDHGSERFLLRTLARYQHEEESKSHVVSFFFEHRRTIHDLMTHADKGTGTLSKYSTEVIDRVAQFLSEQGVHAPSDLLMELQLKIYVNAHCATDNRYISYDVVLGDALYLGASKTNHHCEFRDEYIQYFRGSRIVIKALKDFTVSESIDLGSAYIPSTWSYNERQEFLKKRWHFTCECKRCLIQSSNPGMIPTNRALENILRRPPTPDKQQLLRVLARKYAPLPNKNFYKHLTLSRLFEECPRNSLEESRKLAMAVLEGTEQTTERMKLLFSLCMDYMRFGATEPSHEHFWEFKNIHDVTLKLFTDVYDKDHNLVKTLADMASDDKAVHALILQAQSESAIGT